MYSIDNGIIFTMNKNNDIVKGHSIVIGDDGKILEICPTNRIKNKSYEHIKLEEGTFIFPGFIDAHSHLGLDEEMCGEPGLDVNEKSEPITPNMRALDGMNPNDATVKEALEMGVTSVVICPGSANVIGGLCSAIKLYGHRIDEMIIKEDVAMKCAFGENPKRFYGSKGKMPTTRMGIAALLRETLFKAVEYRDQRKNKKVNFDMKLEAMIPVVNGELPLKVHAHREDDIFSAIRIAKEFNLRITLDHCTSGINIAPEIVKEGFSVIVGPSLGHKTKFELKDKSYKTPGVLNGAGAKVAITTDSPVIPLKYLHLSAGLAVKNGMDKIEALRAITINPAEIAGIADRVGSIEVGKDADLVITDKDPLNDISFKPIYVFVNGKKV